MRLLVILVSLLMVSSTAAQIHLTVDDPITISGYGLDSSGIQQTPDSVRVVVCHDGAEQHDAWYDPSDAQCVAFNGGLTFYDMFGDLDNDAGPGLYEVRAGFFLHDDSLYDWRSLWVYIGVDLAAVEDTVLEIKDLLDARESWSLVGRTRIGDTIQRAASTLTEDSNIGIDWSDIINPGYVAILSGTVIQRVNIIDEDFTTIDLDNATIGRVAEKTGYRLSSEGVGDVWANPSRTLSGLGFALDSADFSDSCFDEVHFTAGYFDSTRGSAGGPDSAVLARAVWNAPSANHTTAGTFGDYLDARVSGLGLGGGAFTVTLTATDTLAGQTVPGVRVAVRNLEQTSLLAVGRTDPSGQVRFNLDAGSFLLMADAPGYLFAPFDTLIVTGATLATAAGRRFDPGAPAAPTLCRVYGFVYDVTGLPDPGAVVSAGLPKGVSRTGELIVSPSAVTTATDTTGYFCLDLIPSAMLDGVPKYEVTITRTDGTILRKRITAPSQASWALSW